MKVYKTKNGGKIRRYTLLENLLSFLIGCVIAIQICVCAARSWSEREIVINEPNMIETTVAEITEDSQENEEDVTYRFLSVFTVTAYCPCEKCCGKWADGYTYTGALATAEHTLAVDPERIPLGSTVQVGDQIYIAEDIGGAVKGDHVEIFFDTHEEALEFGVQKLAVWLVVRGDEETEPIQ